VAIVESVMRWLADPAHWQGSDGIPTRLVQHVQLSGESVAIGILGGVIGVALGFGAQRIVQDVLSGFFMVAEHQYGFGDLVRLNVTGVANSVTGTVEEVTLRITRVRTPDGEVVTTPNGQIVQVINLSRDWARARSVIRSYSRAALTLARPPVAMPSWGARFSIVIALEVSMRVLDGTQSVSTQAPPSPSESTMVTSAPSWVATRAAS